MGGAGNGGGGGAPGGAGAAGTAGGAGGLAGGGTGGTGLGGAGGSFGGGRGGSGGCATGCERFNQAPGSCDQGEVAWRCESLTEVREFLANCELRSSGVTRFCCPESFVPSCDPSDD